MELNIFHTASIALIPVIFGILLRLTDTILEKPKDIRNRISLLEKHVIESLSLNLDRVLEHVRLVIGTDDVLRDSRSIDVELAGTRSTDFIDMYTREVHRAIKVVRVVESVKTSIVIGNWTLLLTTSSGVIMCSIVFLVRDHYELLTVISLIVIALQILSVLLLFSQLNRLRHYESSC